MCLGTLVSGWVGSHAWCNLFRVVPAKFKIGMCEMNIFGLNFVVCLGTLVQDGLAHMRGKQGCVRGKFSDLKFVVCLGTLVQDGLAHMRGVTWRAVPAKFKRGMSEFPSIYMPTRHQLKSFGRHRSWVG